jgi:hypothetical protein
MLQFTSRTAKVHIVGFPTNPCSTSRPIIRLPRGIGSRYRFRGRGGGRYNEPRICWFERHFSMDTEIDSGVLPRSERRSTQVCSMRLGWPAISKSEELSSQLQRPTSAHPWFSAHPPTCYCRRALAELQPCRSKLGAWRLRQAEKSSAGRESCFYLVDPQWNIELVEPTLA